MLAEGNFYILLHDMALYRPLSASEMDKEIRQNTLRTADPHIGRTRELIKKYPQVRELIGVYRPTFFLILLVVGIQFGFAFLYETYHSIIPLWAVFLYGFCIGSVVVHAGLMMIHEAAHRLIFQKNVFNVLAGYLANLPYPIPASSIFAKYHLIHHRWQGVYELDIDMASKWEGRLVGRTFLGKLLWLIFYPLFQAFRVFRPKDVKIADRWVVMNWIFNLSVYGLVLFYFPHAFLFLIISAYFAIGPHPLGARVIQEHFIVNFPQETYSYYGPMDRFLIHTGYHNEHHDFPNIPWVHLPKLHHIAPEYYDNLYSHSSYTKLLFKFLFDNKISLFTRIFREKSARENKAPDIYKQNFKSEKGPTLEKRKIIAYA